MEDNQTPGPRPEEPRPSGGPGQPQPAGYDLEGRPLYYAPPPASSQGYNQPQVVHLARPIDPGKTDVPAEMQRRCEESRRQFPQLNLSDGEFVINAIKRHPFGVIQIWLMSFALIAAFMALFFGYVTSQPAGESSGAAIPLAIAILGILFILILAGAVVASYVYNNNSFYLTNESVVQELQEGLFSKREQTVSLGAVEDASYRQVGIISSFLNFGNIRLSTIGDETTYRFNYVTDPKKQIAILNDAVESFKNGRRVH